MERIVYNPETLSYEVRQLSGWRAVLHFSLMAIGAVAVVAAFCWLWFVKWKNDLPKTALLKIQADAWEARMGVIRHKLDVPGRPGWASFVTNSTCTKAPLQA